MGYDLYITRAESWTESPDKPITRQEWEKLVGSDPELSPTESWSSNVVVAKWSGPSIHSEPWLAWEDGSISSKYPDRALVAKMLEVAKVLNAKLVGEEDEEYKSLDDLAEDHDEGLK